jgi:hypothetical protein
MLDTTGIRIPRSWEEITLSDQIELERLISVGNNRTIAIIAGYCRIPVNEVKKLPISVINDIVDRLMFLGEMPKDKVTEFDYNGYHYSVMQSMLKAEFQDFVSVETLMEQYSGNTYNALPYLCAVMCKRKVADVVIGKNAKGEDVVLPKYESLDDYDILVRGEEFKQLPMNIAYGIYSFFLSFSLMSTIGLTNHTEAQLLLLEQYKISIESSIAKWAGKGWRYRLLAMILRSYVKYIILGWKRYFTTIQSSPTRVTWKQRLMKNILSKVNPRSKIGSI